MSRHPWHPCLAFSECGAQAAESGVPSWAEHEKHRHRPASRWQPQCCASSQDRGLTASKLPCTAQPPSLPGKSACLHERCSPRRLHFVARGREQGGQQHVVDLPPSEHVGCLDRVEEIPTIKGGGHQGRRHSEAKGGGAKAAPCRGYKAGAPLALACIWLRVPERSSPPQSSYSCVNGGQNTSSWMLMKQKL